MFDLSVIRKIQIKTMMKYHCTCIGMTKTKIAGNKKKNIQCCVSKRRDHFYQMASFIKRVIIFSPKKVKLFCIFILYPSKHCTNQY